MGLVDISYLVNVALADKMPLSGIPTLPNMGNSVVDMTEGYRRVLSEDTLIKQEYDSNNVHPLLVNFFPPYQIFSTGPAMRSLEDIKGKKLSAGGGSILFTTIAIGANVIEMGTADIYMGMQNGTIDGAMQSYAAVPAYKFNEVSRSATQGKGFGAAVGIWAIDSGIWAELPPEQQHIITTCGLEAERNLAVWVDNWTESLVKDLQDEGLEIYEFDSAAQERIDTQLVQAQRDYIGRIDKRSLPGSEALIEYQAIIDDVLGQ